MARARLLAGAAVLAAACALPSAAQAQFGPCAFLGSPQPALPCITLDGGKALEQAKELKNKYDQLEKLKEQASEYTSMQGVLGKIKQQAQASYTVAAPVAPIQATTIAAASSKIQSELPGRGQTAEGTSAARDYYQNLVRSSAGDGWAISAVYKNRMQEMQQLAGRLSCKMRVREAKFAANKNDTTVQTDNRTDWQMNTQARSLMLRAMTNLKEIQSARANLEATTVLSTVQGASDKKFERVEAPVQLPAAVPTGAVVLGNLSNSTNKLQALLTAVQLAISFKESLNGFKETQSEYQQILAAANAAQNRVLSLAASDARKKGVSSTSLMQRADQLMASMDRTTWDDPDKSKVAEKAAKYTEDQLDKMVSGDVSNDWSGYLQTRAEAYKQEAFFNPLNQDAIAAENDTKKAILEQEAATGISINDQAKLQAAINAARQEVAAAQAAVAAEGPDVRAAANSIVNNGLACGGYVGDSQSEVQPGQPCDMVQLADGTWSWNANGTKPVFLDTTGKEVPITVINAKGEVVDLNGRAIAQQ